MIKKFKRKIKVFLIEILSLNSKINYLIHLIYQKDKELNDGKINFNFNKKQ